MGLGPRDVYACRDIEGGGFFTSRIDLIGFTDAELEEVSKALTMQVALQLPMPADVARRLEEIKNSLAMAARSLYWREHVGRA